MKKRFIFTLLMVVLILLTLVFFMPSILRYAPLTTEQRETIESALGVSEDGPPITEVNIEWNSHIKEEQAITDFNKGYPSNSDMLSGGESVYVSNSN